MAGRSAEELAAAMRAGCLGARVARLHRVVARCYEQALRPLGITRTQAEVLAELTVARAPVRPGELATLTRLERSSLSRDLAVLRERGWVAVTASSPTGRAMAVEPTEAGRSVLAGADAAWAAAQADMAATLGPDATAVLDGWLARLDAAEA